MLVGYVDGSIYAKALFAEDGSLQLHADTYQGPIECNAEAEPTEDPTSSPTYAPTNKPTDAPTDKPTAAPETPVVTTEAPQTSMTGGDPHFQTWTGNKFDYHGECDLVFLHHPEFAQGLGLRVHLRTTRVNYFSYIETIAIQIGKDVLEFNNDLENYLINGKKVEDASVGSTQSLAGYDVRRFRSAISVRLDQSKENNSNAHIDLIGHKPGFPYIKVDGKGTDIFVGALGMLGDYTTGNMVARDGATVAQDPTEYALEWQVRDAEPMLFSSTRFPQFPTQCTPPKKMLGKRLGDSHMRAAAEKACASWKEDKEDCIFDVMATRNVNMATNSMDTSESVEWTEADVTLADVTVAVR